MKQEDKELLFKDLSARLPYGTIVNVDNGKYREDVKLEVHILNTTDDWDPKPYLRPMPSMTEEEGHEYRMFIDCLYNDFTSESTQCVYVDKINDYLDWLNSRHFDYRGLLERGLALEAPEGMYKT